MVKRETGYYWVKQYGDWTINFWSDGLQGWPFDSTSGDDDTDFSEIREDRITAPDEEKK